jgi:hypothetical protein
VARIGVVDTFSVVVTIAVVLRHAPTLGLSRLLTTVDTQKYSASNLSHPSRPDKDVRPRTRHRSPLTNRRFVRGLFFVRIFPLF